jgi:putative salt-induced outer membrane protein YdiY
MSRKLVVFLLFLGFWLVPSWAVAGTQGKVTLKDGSQVYGEIVEMAEGMITIKTLFHDGEPLKIKWSEVTGIDTEDPLTFVLSNGIILRGQPAMAQPGTLDVKTELLAEPIPVQVGSILAVNPPEKKAVAFTGNFNFGGSVTSGNTDVKNFSFVGELIARSERLRLSMLGRYLYGENDGELNARNAYGTVKMDFFVSKRFYVYTGVLFEQDTFQDLNLRSSIFAGPGYQFIEVGDYASPYLKKLSLHGEIGLGYFNEDYKRADDMSYFTGRWGVNFHWPVLPWLTVFHQHQGFPSLEKNSDWYVTSQQGIRMNIWENFLTTFQVNWRYDNAPAAGTKKADTQYILSLGYAFES